MTYCGICGTQVAEGYSHCPNCGTPVAGAPGAAAQMRGGMQGMRAAGGARRPASGKKPVKMGLIIGLCAALVAVIAIIVTIVVLTGGPSSFSVKQAVMVTTEGFDGAGTLKVTVDRDEMERLMRAAKPDLTDRQRAELLGNIEISIPEKD